MVSIQGGHFLFTFLLWQLSCDHRHWTDIRLQYSLILVAHSFINSVPIQEWVWYSRTFLVNTHIPFKTTFSVDTILEVCG